MSVTRQRVLTRYTEDMLSEIGLKPPTMDLPVFLHDDPPAL